MAAHHFHLKLSFDGDWNSYPSYNQGHSSVQAFYKFVRGDVVCQWNLVGK